MVDTVVRNENGLVVIRLNGEPHIEPIDAVAHVSQSITRRRNYLSFELHAGILKVSEIHLQPDPLFPGAESAARYRVPDYLHQFTKTHAIVTFSEPVVGPLVIGAGRYIGLGLMAGFDRQN